jgi:hypothetical protein
VSLKRILLFMAVVVPMGSFAAPSVNDVFEAHTFQVFGRDDVELNLHGDGRIEPVGEARWKVIADISLLVKRERSQIVDSIADHLLSRSGLTFPVNRIEGANESEREEAREIMAKGVADGVVRATLGSDVVVGKVVVRPGSEVILRRDSRGFFINSLGERIYVSEPK